MAVWDAGLAQARQLWGGLTGVQRAVLVAVTVGLAVGFALLALWAGRPEYAVLFSRLAPEDAAQVVEALQERGVPYQIEAGGSSVMVPVDRVYETRLALAGEGIPQGGLVGFEIFDRSSFGMTDFAQKVNYARALEGELTRTIRRLEGVEGARVHLVMPERRLFEEAAQEATASVVLQLAAGRQLTAKQIQGVVYLVSSSVEGLAPDRITVVDTRGNVLYQSQGDEVGLLAGNQLEYQRAFERDTELRVRQMLERVLGSGAVVVQVAAEFDFDRVQETSEAYDPDGVVVRSEERTSETTAGAGGPTGIPGVTSNVGPEAETGTAAGGAGSSTRESETVNYEVSKTVTRVERTPGELERLTVAVAVDGTYRETEDGEREFVPRTAEELDQLESLVARAVGVDPGRGDAVEVRSIPFRPAESVERAQVLWSPDLLAALAKYGVTALVVLVVLLAVVRPLIRWLTAGPGEPEVAEPMTVAEMERKLEGKSPEEYELDETTPSETVKRETLKKRLRELMETEPEVAAQLIRSWIAEE